MVPTPDLRCLSNPLATVDQLSHSSSSVDGVPADLETSIRYAGVRLTQAAGVLLSLPQDVIAHAIVIFTRFWLGPEGGSLVNYGAKEVSAASLYLAAKGSFYPQSPRSVLRVYACLLSPTASPLSFVNPSPPVDKPNPEDYYLSEGNYQVERLRLQQVESDILRLCGFNVRVVVPHTIALTYVQALTASSPALAKRVFEHLNSALFSPQLVYVTHQPNALAVAAIYLAAREVGVKLVDVEWWEVFDVDREDLGFIVVAMRSIEGFARSEEEKWKRKKIPMTVAELGDELQIRKMMETGE